MADQTSHWKMIELFFLAYKLYLRLEFDFAKHVRKPILQKVDSYESFIVYLNSRDLSYLRDNYLTKLRSLSHAGFRSRKRLERFDLYISEIFHEFSILKEQKFILEHSLKNKDQVKIEVLKDTLQATYTLFKTKISVISNLFQNAKSRLEKILPTFQKEDFILRKLYLDGPKALRSFYEKPIEDILGFMFPEGGYCEGLIAIAASFGQGGFFRHSFKALSRVKKKDFKNMNRSLAILYEKYFSFLKLHQDSENMANTFHLFNQEIKPLFTQLTLN